MRKGSRLLLALLVAVSCAHDSTSTPAGGDGKGTDATLDPEILTLLSQVDATAIAKDVATLAGFGTRNSCSDTSGAGPTGIGAACPPKPPACESSDPLCALGP